MPLTPSAHVDTFARDNLPPEQLWPRLEFTLPELQYPERLNAAEVLLDQSAERFGFDRVALRAPAAQDWGMPDDQSNTWTYGDLQRRVNQVARVFTEDYGVLPGNRVLLRIPNNPWAVITWLAALKAGAVAVTTMVAWRRAELTKMADRTTPSLVIVDHRFVSELEGAFASDVPVVTLGGTEDQLIGASAAKSSDFAAVDTAADDVALLASTSGTTGEPKITAHFHRDILAVADTFARHTLGILPDDVIAGSPPLAFTFGLGGLVVFPMRFGASSFIIEKPGPTALADAIEHEGVNVLFTAPTGYRTMLREGRAAALRMLRVGVSAGEHLPKETFDAVQKTSGLRLVDGIGATEMLHVFISASGKDTRPGATGMAVPGYRAAVLDDDGNELPAGGLGRLAVIGPTGCRYLADERQADYVQDGWNITGDLYTRDEDGYFTYAGRSDDMIIASGYNVGAPEVEAVIDTHPGVVESAVVARPHPEKGAIVNAFVVIQPGVPEDDGTRESIEELVRAQLAPYKIPRRIDFIDVLPRNPSGKLQRFPLRQRARQEAAASILPSEGTTQ